MNNRYKKIGVLGAGSWGTVLADIAANNGYEVLIWSRNPNTVNDKLTRLARHRKIVYLQYTQFLTIQYQAF